METQTQIKRPSNRKFGLVFSAVFLFFGWYFSGEDSNTWLYVGAGLAATFLLVALAVPRVLGPLNVAWMALGEILGKVVSPVFLALLYFVVVTPYAFVARLFGHDELGLKRRSADSFWVARTLPGPAVDGFTRQY